MTQSWEKPQRGLWLRWRRFSLLDIPFAATASHISNYLNKRNGQNKRDVLDIVRGLYCDNATLSTELTLQPQQLTEVDIRRIVSEEINQRLSDIETISHSENTILVPEADTIKGEGQGRRLKRVYEKVSTTVDSVLWKLFRQEQRRLENYSSTFNGLHFVGALWTA